LSRLNKKSSFQGQAGDADYFEDQGLSVSFFFGRNGNRAPISGVFENAVVRRNGGQKS
jgi:hypothetical protein